MGLSRMRRRKFTFYARKIAWEGSLFDGDRHWLATRTFLCARTWDDEDDNVPVSGFLFCSEDDGIQCPANRHGLNPPN